MRQFFGKYRGKVTSSKDPSFLGRIQVSVPAVLGDGTKSWAMPCVPYAGKDIGLFMVPPVNSNVWVEFEGGDPDYPIWSGCFWGKGELPKNARVPDQETVQVFETEGVTLTVSRFGVTKGISLEIDEPVVEKPMKLVFDAKGIEINHHHKTTAKFLADSIEIKTGEQSAVTIANDSIQLKEKAVEIALTGNSIELKNNPSVIKLDSSNVTLSNSSAKVKIAPAGIELANSPGKAKVAPSGVELGIGAASVKLSPVSVNVNNGALEVI
ncbi:MAG: phage baseplate assembly protein V [Phormidesmis sp.]